MGKRITPFSDRLSYVELRVIAEIILPSATSSYSRIVTLGVSQPDSNHFMAIYMYIYIYISIHIYIYM